MRAVGNTQVGGDGRLQTMLADPSELHAAQPAAPHIPRAPRGPGGRRKASPIWIILGMLAVTGVVGFFVVIWALGYELELGGRSPRLQSGRSA